MKKVAGSRLEFLEYFILLITSPNPHMVMVVLVVMVVVVVVWGGMGNGGGRLRGKID